MLIENGQGVVSAGTHPLLLLWGVLAAGLYGLLMRQKIRPLETSIPSMKRRAAAFLIDFYFILLALGSLTAFLPLTAEAVRTGKFQWQFERHYTVASDAWIGPPLVLGAAALTLLYFALPLTRGKPTVGCFLLRLTVAAYGESAPFTWRAALMRTWYEFRGLCSWTIARKRARDEFGRTWYDLETACTVLQYTDRSPGK